MMKKQKRNSPTRPKTATEAELVQKLQEALAHGSLQSIRETIYHMRKVKEAEGGNPCASFGADTVWAEAVRYSDMHHVLGRLHGVVEGLEDIIRAVEVLAVQTQDSALQRLTRRGRPPPEFIPHDPVPPTTPPARRRV